MESEAVAAERSRLVEGAAYAGSTTEGRRAGPEAHDARRRCLRA